MKAKDNNIKDRRRSAQLVAEIYEATIDPDHWQYVVTMIAKLTRSKSACLYYKNKDLESASNLVHHGLPDSEGMGFSLQRDRFDAMFCQGRVTPGESLCMQFYPGSSDVMPDHAEVYLQWMKPNGLYHVGGLQLLDDDTHKAGIVILRDAKAGAWSDGELRIINEILPHLRRALNIHTEYSFLRHKQDALLQGLDRLVIGLILYDQNARPVYINPTALAIIAAHPAMRLQEDELVFDSPGDTRKLRKLILHAAEMDPEDSWKLSAVIGINHPDVEAPLPLLVTPIHANLVTADLDYEGAKVAVFISDSNEQQPISVDNLVRVYNLSRSEATVTISLVNGHSIDEIAGRTNHSVHTIRAQVKSVFRKAGVSSQSELIKQLLTGPLAMHQVVKMQLGNTRMPR